MFARMIRSILLVLSAMVSMSAQAVDAKRFEILKGIHYFQIADGVSQLQTNNAYRFTVQVYADALGDVLGSSIYTPKIPRIDLLPDKDGDPYRFRDKFDDDGSLEVDYPNGTYQLGIRGLNDGDHTMTFALSGDVYPAAPIVNDYAGLQNLIYNEYNQISWRPFAGGGANDFIQLQIEDLQGNNVWETPDFGEDGALDGTATHTILPADTLAPGVVYVGTIRFTKVLYNSSDAYPRARGTVGYFKRTEFTIRPKAIGLEPVVDRLQIWRRHRFEQFADGSITEQTVPWEFESRLDAIASNLVTAVRLRLPSGSTNDFTPDETFSQFDSSSPPITNQTVFASIYKDGAYTYDITRVDSTVQHAVVNLPAGVFPPEPRMLNLSSLTNHPGGEPITVNWQPWIGAGADDFIRVELFNEDGKVWDTSNYSSAKHLRPTATSVTIEGTNFVAGHDYTIEVHFYHITVSDTQVIPGALTFGGFDSRTKFDFSAQLPDVVSFRVAEGQYFWQRGTNKFEADPVGPYRFEARAIAATTNSLRSAQFTTPQGSPIPLIQDSTRKVFQFNAADGVAASLADRYPAGVYTMRFDTRIDGARTSAVTLPPIELPPLPFILNFSNLWQGSAGAGFPIRWRPWANVNTNTDTIQFSIEKLNGAVVFSSEDPNTKHPLLPTSTNVVVLGDELLSKQSYLARLRFERRVRTESPNYPGARGTAAIFSELAFYVSTLSTNYMTNFTSKVTLTNGLVQIGVSANSTTPLQINRPYTLFETHDFMNWSIAKVEALTVPYFRIPPPSEPTFYKAAILP